MPARSAAVLLLFAAAIVAANPVDLPTPPDSVRFGEEFAVLPNGNIVVVDRDYSVTAPGAGAAYLFRPDGTLVSTITGSSANDSIGNWGITVLPGGNYLIESRDWDNGAAVDAGAITFGDADTGVSGVVSAENSLVGTSNGDRVGSVFVFANGHYAIATSSWANGAVDNVGAVTWGDGDVGVTGPVTATNSLIGSTANDFVGGGGVFALANGHGVVVSSGWNDGATVDAGAVTWIRGDVRTTGVVSTANSIIGTSASDFLGARPYELANGHYVVASHWWDNGGIADAGAVTWARGDGPTAAVVSAANSLVGTQPGDFVGSGRVHPLPDGAYVVSSPRWDLGGVADVGAVTRVDGGAPFAGTVTSGNSLHGSSLNDRIAEDQIVVLANGNYVVAARFWDDGATANVGAVTWCPGATGCVGAISAANSLVGTATASPIGNFVFALDNGNYLVQSRDWDHGAIADAGAVTFANGTTGLAGSVSAANSLVGATAGDRVGSRIVALSNGHYVVSSFDWDHGGIANVGAVTWGDGVTGTVGVVAATNSMIGSLAGDRVGQQLDALVDGRYVVGSPGWDRGALQDAGAATWLDGTVPSVGTVSESNSLVGARAFDELGVNGATPLPDGGAVLGLDNVDSDAGADTGAVLLAPPGGLIGEIPAHRAVFGTVPDEGAALYHEWDAINAHLVVAHAPANRVTILEPPADALFANGFE